MFVHLLKKEIFDNLASARFLLIFLMCSVLVILSLMIGMADYQHARQHHDLSVAQMKETASQQVSYQALGVWGMFKVYRQPALLFPFAKGVEEASGSNTVVSIFHEPKLQDSRYSAEPIYAQFSSLDFLFVIKAIVALFALMLTFDLINGEAEKGTLKLLLANPVPRSTVLHAKLAGALLSLLLPLLIPVMLGIMLMLMSGQMQWQAEHWLRIGLLLASSLLYLSIFVVLGLLFSCLVQRSSDAFLWLVLCWLLAVWVIPRLSLFIANLVTAVPATYEIERQKGEIDRQWYRDSEHSLQQWLLQHPELSLVPADIAGQINAELQQQAQRYKSRLDEEYRAQQQQRIQLTLWLARLSPTAAFENIVLVLTQTDMSRQQHFLEQVKSYRHDFQTYVSQKMMEERKLQLEGRAPAVTAGLDLTGMPELEFKTATLATDLPPLFADVTVLLLYLTGGILLCYDRFLRYQLT
jgi:ABC-type transport system involved in multi-copper enzyme maturation permease subunit